jgi:hypothetical protein
MKKYWIITVDSSERTKPYHIIVYTIDEDLLAFGESRIYEGEDLNEDLPQSLIKALGIELELGDWIAVDPSDQPVEFID